VNSGTPVTFIVSIANIGNQPIDGTAIWEVHLEYSGTAGTMAISAPAGIVCSNFPPPPPANPETRHQHCVSTAGPDAMDLGAGQGLTLTVTVTPSAAGTGNLNVVADTFNGITGEFDELPGNNEANEVIDVN
jgi:hypothetical protein